MLDFWNACMWHAPAPVWVRWSFRRDGTQKGRRARRSRRPRIVSRVSLLQARQFCVAPDYLNGKSAHFVEENGPPVHTTLPLRHEKRGAGPEKFGLASVERIGEAIDPISETDERMWVFKERASLLKERPR